MELVHTSPYEVIEANSIGLFDEFIFFAADAYVMTAGEYYIHTVEIDEDEIIDASSLWFEEDYEKAQKYVDELASDMQISEDLAMDLISGSVNFNDLDADEYDAGANELYEIDYNIQRLAARCAAAMGYTGVRVIDEQGSAVMLPASLIDGSKGVKGE